MAAIFLWVYRDRFQGVWRALKGWTFCLFISVIYRSMHTRAGHVI